MSEIKTNKISPRKGTTTTIADSGDTVTVSSGANLNNAGTLTISNIVSGSAQLADAISGSSGAVSASLAADTAATLVDSASVASSVQIT